MRIRRTVRCPVCGANYFEEEGRSCPVCERGSGVVRPLQGEDGHDRPGRHAHVDTRSHGESEGGRRAPNTPPLSPDAYICGWLVIHEGAQAGRSYRLTARKNAIGGAGCAVDLDFASGKHAGQSATILYDPIGNAFFALNADGPDIAYVDGDLLLTPRRLHNGDILSIGGVSLRFVPFCTDRFRWDVGAP